ncbi:MAG: hypothetical protein ACK55I_51225, partial [bacterium]
CHHRSASLPPHAYRTNNASNHVALFSPYYSLFAPHPHGSVHHQPVPNSPVMSRQIRRGTT